ncbi:antitoxin VapB family protein [Candidatus Woesearchaeota archaeon]|nr:antitoxin VapB family protein [Candidatus Woesearchaeota archaeon]
MATKTITITEDSYQRLNALKEKNESFSDVIRRVTGKVKLTDFAGILTEEEADKLEKSIEENRKRSTKRMLRIREELS